jgi:L-lactate dehydrogenase complex protein LldF
LIGGKLINYVPTKLIPVPALRAWENSRTLPKWRGGEFRKWMKNRDGRKNAQDAQTTE